MCIISLHQNCSGTLIQTPFWRFYPNDPSSKDSTLWALTRISCFSDRACRKWRSNFTRRTKYCFWITELVWSSVVRLSWESMTKKIFWNLWLYVKLSRVTYLDFPMEMAAFLLVHSPGLLQCKLTLKFSFSKRKTLPKFGVCSSKWLNSRLWFRSWSRIEDLVSLICWRSIRWFTSHLKSRLFTLENLSCQCIKGPLSVLSSKSITRIECLLLDNALKQKWWTVSKMTKKKDKISYRNLMDPNLSILHFPLSIRLLIRPRIKRIKEKIRRVKILNLNLKTKIRLKLKYTLLMEKIWKQMNLWAHVVIFQMILTLVCKTPKILFDRICS